MPRRPRGAAPRTAEAFRLLGSVAFYAGKKADAESLIRQALALNPEVAGVSHENLSVVLFSVRRLAEAEAAARQALELSPDFAEAANRLGNALHEQGRMAEAARADERSLILRPGERRYREQPGLRAAGAGPAPRGGSRLQAGTRDQAGSGAGRVRPGHRASDAGAL